MKQLKSSTMLEACKYQKPSAFSRGMSVKLKMDTEMIFISGTASVGENGDTLYKGNFKKQTKRMFENITALLKNGGITWKNVIKTTIYLRDIDRDYEEFNVIRKDFYDKMGLSIYPASVCVEAKLCRNDLLVEMELIAIKDETVQ
jgi:enamine deaminase RidA (YjgF/YER057c/UK114 family)